jgi:iron complex outermembrane recepter protein
MAFTLQERGQVMRKSSSGLLAVALSGLVVPALAQTALKQYTLQIDRQPLVATLRDLSQQTGLQLVGLLGADREIAGQVVGPLKGEYTAEAALNALLAQSGLVFRRVNDRTIAILGPQVETALPRPSAGTHMFIPLDAAGGSASPLWQTTAATTQTEGGAASSRDGDTVRRQADAANDIVEEVIVTGTYIRGEAPVGSPIKRYSRAEIDKTGAATVEQFARTMSENFSSADTTANSFSSVGMFGRQDAANLFGGATFDLRGIGASSTLTLLNGNRLAAGGLTGAMTDISQIPVSAIERIEVMADGASAIYGADAVAGVVNIITRNDFEGAETSASYGAATDDGAEQFVASQLLGASWADGNVLLNYEYNKQEELDASQRDYLPDQGGPYTLIPENRKNNVFVAARQSLGPRTKLSANGIYGERETAMQAHTENMIYESDSSQLAEVKQSGASVALEHQISAEWTLTGVGNYSGLRQEIASDQVLSSSPSRSEIEANSKLFGVDVLASGTLAHLPAGGLKGAIGMSARKEKFESLQTTVASGFSNVDALPEVSRRVNSAYAELRLPVVGGRNSMAWAKKLELSGAVRYDDYDDVGSTTNSKVGFNWAPIERLQFRGTYGTSFRAPLLAELKQSTAAYVIPYPDPTSAGGVSNTIILSGGNSSLKPEEATSITAGFDFQPLDTNLVIAMTYFDIDFKDRITQPPFSGDPFTNPITAPFLNRNPPLADVEAIFASPGFRGDFSFQGPAGVDVIWDQRRANIARTQESGVDFSTSYEWPTELGRFSFSLTAQRLLDNDYEIVEGSTPIQLLNTFAQPPKWKGRGGVTWAYGDFQTALTINYVNSYTNGLGASPGVPGSTQVIDSWSTADVYLGYAPQSIFGLFRDFRIALSINNLTDEEPPFAEIPTALTLPGATVLPFDATNASALGRFISLRIAKQW